MPEGAKLYQRNTNLNSYQTSPAVRNMAIKHGIDLNEIQGTGRDDRITKEDVNMFLLLVESHQIPYNVQFNSAKRM